MKFTKMHGLGNDYVYVDCFKERVENAAALARVICDRHTGVGGDGLILIRPSSRADVRMEMYNADGSRAQMCGNGIRCVAKYALEHELVPGRIPSGASFKDTSSTTEARLYIETDAGIKEVRCNVAGGKVRSVRVDMGPPLLAARAIPSTIPVDHIVNYPFRIRLPGPDPFPEPRASARADLRELKHFPFPFSEPRASARADLRGPEHFPFPFSELRASARADVRGPVSADGHTEYLVTCVSMGNPHAVVFVDDPDAIALEVIGPQFEHAPEFPERINVHFVRVDSPGHVTMRTWERGSGPTRACGTGACAACVAGAITDRTARKLITTMPGGDLEIEWADNDHVYMTGPAVEVFTGHWPDG